MLKTFAHKVAFPFVETINVGSLRLVRLVRPPSARKMIFTGKDRVLVVAPHPDDETLGCGGTIGLHLRAGDNVCVTIVTDGRNSRAGGLASHTMVELRTKEAQRAMEVLRCRGSSYKGELELLQFLLPEDEWRNEELIELLTRQINEWKPSIIYATSYVDFHPDHLRVAHALAQTLECMAQANDMKIRAYEIQVPLTQALANVYADIRATVDRRVEALTQYKTQAGSFLWVRRYGRYLKTAFNVRVPIEVFWEMEPSQYIAIHGEAGTRSGFRSIRLRPFSDLAGWVLGSRQRYTFLSLAQVGRKLGE